MEDWLIVRQMIKFFFALKRPKEKAVPSFDCVEDRKRLNHLLVFFIMDAVLQIPF
jgi:hypothetical protein